MTKVKQIGLFCRNEESLEAFADRVSDYNKEKGFVVVEMEGYEADADELCDATHWKINLEFKSRAYAKDFWTDPKYMKQVYVPE
jgi:uncharacterized protein (DUF1330 family)